MTKIKSCDKRFFIYHFWGENILNITDHIEEWRKCRNGLSFAFLAERCPTSDEAPYRITPASPLLPEENCVVVLAGTGGKGINLRGYNGMLKQTDNFVKNNVDLSHSPVRVCVAVCDFGKKHFDKVARKGAYYETWWPQELASLKHNLPEDCVDETFNPAYIQDIFEQVVLPRIVSENGNERIPLRQAEQNIRRLNIVAHCHGAFVATRLEKLMDNKMNELRYSQEEQLKIKSQLLVLAYNPDCPKYISKFRFISIESSQDRHNEYQSYLREWLLMSPKDFGVCFIPKSFGQALMCAQVDKFGIEGNPSRKAERISGSEWFKQVHGVDTGREKRLSEHNFLGFEPVGNMSKGALKLQTFANNILKNAIKNSQSQSGDNFIPLPNIQPLTANTLGQRLEFARAAIIGYKLMMQMQREDRSKIDAHANWRRSIPVIELD